MPGIAGVIYPDVLQVSEIIQPMLAILHHRGAFPHNTRTFKNIQIGICGANLALNERKSISLILDGTIDNITSLKRELEKGGKPWETDDQSELLIHAYELWGADFLTKIDGDFAIALVDQTKGNLLLARDRVGKKPLYWYQDQHHFLFASELKALLSTGIVPQTPSQDGLSSYLFFGYIPQDLSPIKDVNKLLPGHYLLYRLKGGKTILPYWSYSACFEKKTTLNQKSITHHLDELLSRSISQDVSQPGSKGSFISGGLGSATVGYYLDKVIQDKSLKAYTVGFEGQNDSDIAAAKIVTRTLQLPHEIHKITPHTLLNDILSIVWYLDEPLADPNITATWQLAKSASDQSYNVFSGMGADELFAGHYRYSIAERAMGPVSSLFFLPKPFLKYIAIPFLNIFYQKAAFNILKVLKTNPWQFEYLRHNSLFPENILKEVSPKMAGIFDPDCFLHKFHHLSLVPSLVDSFLYFDLKTRLPDSFILQYERLTTAFGLNWKTPFLKQPIIEFSAALPKPENLSPTDTAHYLKPLIQNIFPASFVNRPKKTRKEFLNSWVQNSEIHACFAFLLKGTLVDTGLISEEWLRRQMSPEYMSGETFRFLWSILMLEIWFRLYINHPIQLTPPQMTLKDLFAEG